MAYKIINKPEKIDRKQWSEFVCNHPQGNIFQTPEMYDVYKNTKNYEPFFLAVINEDDEILGILLSVIQHEYKRPIGNLTARSIIWGGPLIKKEDPQVFELILRNYERIVRRRAVYSQFRNLWNMQKFKEIFIHLRYTFEDHLNIIVDLSKSESLLWKEVHSKRRNEIRRAIKEGTSVLELKNFVDLDNIYWILHEVYKNAKLPIADKSLFVESFKVLGLRGMIKYFGAFNNNEIIGGICILCYRETLYNWYAGSLRKFYNKYPNDLLPWEVFKWGKKNGYLIFDFGGAGKPDKKYGVRDYKKKFGGRLVNYGRFEKIHMPIKFNIAKAGFSLWKKIRR